MTFAIFILTSCIALGHFCDFLIGEKGQRRVKDRLIDAYVHLSEPNWTRIIQSSASSYLRYLHKLFGKIMFTKKFIVSVFVYSLGFYLLVWIFRASADGGWGLFRFYDQYHDVHVIDATIYAIILLSNMTIDMLSIRVTMLGLKSVCLFRYYVATFCFIVSSSLAWLGLCLGNLSVEIALELNTRPQDFDGIFGGIYWLYLIFGQDLKYRGIIYFFFGGLLQPSSYRVFSLQIIIPITTFFIVVFGAFVIYFLRPVLQRPLLLVVERLEKSKSGICTSLASVLGALVASLTAWSKW